MLRETGCLGCRVAISLGEQRANQNGESARYSPDVPLTAKEIAEVRLRYAQLSRPGLRDAYTEALERCRLDARGRAPQSVHIQVLVQAWKALRKRR
jgi:hypothetical protein